ncbi:uncharacterized protein BDCG_00483 [Blastomyces dermatitidis ER-3]|uniref:Uncharacterized protein n=3 Tax=Blastomyces TaxID=229219 RepID=A0A179ULL2_BLAGS|nr:uncharacterized protein BDBG_04932 [Blastomyces gilchristii SLH14081]XP_045271813.1 uncharacterized protein BDCG_00483 [Blastomyces dermatitidis ER-3]EEQ83678.2 hypothetical protein BDCG_00483 [Blastomyces dermatitidis ER-3]OAT08693.1 hypothetical protein BDBG_04932 [Blastomyces gilchristii SLH14081]
MLVVIVKERWLVEGKVGRCDSRWRSSSCLEITTAYAAMIYDVPEPFVLAQRQAIRNNRQQAKLATQTVVSQANWNVVASRDEGDVIESAVRSMQCSGWLGQ